jgi:hypothetical protein
LPEILTNVSGYFDEVIAKQGDERRYGAALTCLGAAWRAAMTKRGIGVTSWTVACKQKPDA